MDYRVEDLAAAAGVTVDTLRYYQGKGLLPAPRRVGRRVVYGSVHLEGLQRIREWQEQGLSLAVIRRLVGGRREDGPQAGSRAGAGRSAPAARGPANRRSSRPASAPALEDRLLDALVAARGPARLSRGELATAAGVPEELVSAVVQAGLVEPVTAGGQETFGATEVDMARAALALLREGLPIGDLLGLAIAHSANVRVVVDRAMDLFTDHVRHTEGDERPAEEVVHAFQRLIPAVTALVANHFHRTLVARALARLERDGERDALAHAIEATRSGRLEVAWR